MESKSLIYGLIGFILGGLVVSVAATTFDKPNTIDQPHARSSMSMEQMVASLAYLEGDKYDEEFVAGMIDHHQAAVDMAKLSASRAKHAEINKLSDDIVVAQEKEIQQMKQWQKNWNYDTSMTMENMQH